MALKRAVCKIESVVQFHSQYSQANTVQRCLQESRLSLRGFGGSDTSLDKIVITLCRRVLWFLSDTDFVFVGHVLDPVYCLFFLELISRHGVENLLDRGFTKVGQA